VVIFPAKATNNPHGLGVRLTIGVSHFIRHLSTILIIIIMVDSTSYLISHTCAVWLVPVVRCFRTPIPQKHIVQPRRYAPTKRWCVHQISDSLQDCLEVILFWFTTDQQIQTTVAVVAILTSSSRKITEVKGERDTLVQDCYSTRSVTDVIRNIVVHSEHWGYR
jgi:hypothetical protein